MAGNTLSNKEHPLTGVIVCFTSILPEQRTELATIAGEMGATHKFDLTSDVTHLLVGEVCTPKYKFVARERPDVVVLKPEWIQAVRQSWVNGEDTDTQALEEQYKLPLFLGLSICITGFEDMAFRNRIQKTAVAHGAEFKKDLSKTVTHLIAQNAEGEKYKYASQWNTKVVSVKWFNDSIERGMILEETLYHPLLPSERQGVGAWNRSVSGIRQKAVEHDGFSNPRPRKLRRVASTKLGSQNEGIWGDIVGSGLESSEPKVSGTRQKRNDITTQPKPSVLQEAKSFASETTFPDAQESRPQLVAQNAPSLPDGFLQGCYFFIYGFTSKQSGVLRQHLQFNGAQLVDSLSDFSRPDIPKNGDSLYIIVSYKTPRSGVPSTDDFAFECEVVTDMWLERCLDTKALVPPESHIASTPFPQFPIPGFHGMRVCSTGFARIDLLHLSKLVSLMGASYDEYLTPKASVLICNDPISANHEKLRHTSEWGVPVVSADWLYVSVQTGQKKPFGPYIIRKATSQDLSTGQRRPDKRSQQKHTPSHSENSSEDAQPMINGTVSGHVAYRRTKPDPQSHVQKTMKKQAEFVMGDGFDKEPSDVFWIARPASRSKSSPTKQINKVTANTVNTASNERPEPNHSTSSTGSSTFGHALNGILQQARAAKARLLADPEENNNSNNSATGRRRRKPLVGRANSTTDQSIFSRASSIDTLNEDGCGSAIESVNAEGNNITTRPNSGNGRQQSFTSLLSGGKLEFADDATNSLYPHYEENEDQIPAMTQLDYEDPDAAAMREEFLLSAGRVTEKKTPTEQGFIVGMEDMGWGNGRKTRQTSKVVNG